MKIVHRNAASLAATVVTILTLVALASGCNTGKSAPTPVNFTHAINAHFLDHTDCLFADMRFPFETGDAEKTKQMDSLVKALLLEKTYESSVRVSRYTISKAGTRFAPHFCYGHREVASIDNSTPIAVVDGFKETTVTYTYTMKEVPVWALGHDIQAAFPEMAHAINSQTTAKATLAQTAVGWQVPD